MSLKELSHPADEPEEGTVQRKYFLSSTAVDRLERAASRARLSLSRTLDMLIMEGTRYLDEPDGEELVYTRAVHTPTPVPLAPDSAASYYDDTDFDPDVTEE